MYDEHIGTLKTFRVLFYDYMGDGGCFNQKIKYFHRRDTAVDTTFY
jgi:hypothetical protein